MLPVISGLWIGKTLSVMERLSIRSFLANGHEFHLYAYDTITDVPDGTIVKDGATILPASMIFQYSGRQSYAGFANYFRYKLLLEAGGWWVDLDTICLKPFTFDRQYVFAAEHTPQGNEAAVPGIMFTPPASKVMQYAWESCKSKDPAQLKWGETGPQLLQEAVRHCGLQRYVLPASSFCPVPWFRWMDLILPGRPLTFGPTTYAIHLWNEVWRQLSMDKNEAYAPHCLYEHLKVRYGLNDPSNGLRHKRHKRDILTNT